MPGLGSFAVADITGPQIRRWRNNLLDSGVGPVTVAKAYRLLKAIMTTAVDDQLIRRNPLTDGALVTGPPKSASGVRWVSIPSFLLPDVIEHLEQFTGSADDQLIFTGPKGAQLRRSNFTRQWRKALTE